MEGSNAQSTVTYQMGQLYGTQYLGTSFMPIDADLLKRFPGMVNDAIIRLLGARRAARFGNDVLREVTRGAAGQTSGPHQYEVETIICNIGECLRQTVFDEVRRFPARGRPLLLPGQSVPCMGEPRSTCGAMIIQRDMTLVELSEAPHENDNLGGVTHDVDIDGFCITNITRPDHKFKPGEVERCVIVEPYGDVIIRTVGTGDGLYPDVNKLMAPSYWKAIDNEIKVRINHNEFPY